MNNKIIEHINQLEYNFEDFELQHFLDHIQQSRNREIMLLPVKNGDDASALWVKSKETDYILYNSNIHSIHQTHGILHEIAHIILGHKCIPIKDLLSEDILVQLQNFNPIGRPRLARNLLKDDPEEKEAEEFVYVIQKEVIDANRFDELLGKGSSNQVLNKYVLGVI